MGDEPTGAFDVCRLKPFARIAMGFATVAAMDIEERVGNAEIGDPGDEVTVSLLADVEIDGIVTERLG
jgi:hypothetical protein